MRLARIASESGSLYVDKFRDAAIEHGPSSPEVLLTAYHLSVERGEEYQETRAHEWFQKAVALSDEGGPVQTVSLKDLVARSTGWNKRVDNIDAKPGHAVQIEPGLWSRSPENGNIPRIRWRLAAILHLQRPISEPGDRQPIHKSPPLAGISEATEGKVSGRRTGWLATQC
jgi:hypothetical protein